MQNKIREREIQKESKSKKRERERENITSTTTILIQHITLLASLCFIIFSVFFHNNLPSHNCEIMKMFNVESPS